ncbi:hypothetical protein [Frankia sp. Cj5]|uniref:hypothetical protein n=1 Tax=Frankia sp. Cj5 TaxID=2880978 RepID=UPI001EF468A8|nr:hypothetical protein [Frankia sp. Cj5]
MLEVESGANDPIAIMLTIGLVETWRADPGLADWVVFAVRQMAGGLAVGVLAGLAGSRLLMRVNLGPSGRLPGGRARRRRGVLRAGGGDRRVGVPRRLRHRAVRRRPGAAAPPGHPHLPRRAGQHR